MATVLWVSRKSSRAFTLIELVVVLAILSILGSLTLAGLMVGREKGKVETTRFIVQKLSAAVMDRYEDYEDLATGGSLVSLRARMREEMPDSWHDVYGSPGSNLTLPPQTPAGRAYQQYYASGGGPSPSFASAECLYMIVTQSGLFPDLLSEIRSDQVGDIDNDGKKEFWDAWKRPIGFFRWAPGFSSPLSPVQVADPGTHHDPIDAFEVDSTAFAMFPLIYSAGPDESTNDTGGGTPVGYGLIESPNGWPDSALGSPCTFSRFGAGLVGAPDPENSSAYRDNIFSHDLMGN